MILSIRKKTRFIVTMLLLIFLQTYSVEVYALTSGPAQEEYASFEPIGTTDMVNLYSGDFTYNIPLLSVPGPNGGYPINLAYHSGIGMDQEASWVGLGWNVNVGAINRNLRGLPDDFNGDKVTHEQHMRKSWTVGLNLFQEGKEKFGFGGSSGPLQLYYNNYKGVGYRIRTAVFPGVSKFINNATSEAVDLSLQLSYDPHEGIGVAANFGVSGSFLKNGNASLGVSGSWNSRQGLQGVSVNGSVSKGFTNAKTGNGFYVGLSGGVSFNFNQGVPAVTMPMYNTIFSTDLKMGFSPDNFLGIGVFNTIFPLDWTGTYSESKVRSNGIIESSAYGYMNSENATDYDLKDFSYTPISYNNKLPYLSPSNVTNDVFSIAGQGTGGVFRGYRADIGVFSQKNTTSLTKQDRFSLDVGVSSITPPPVLPLCPINYQFGVGGIPVTVGIAKDRTGAWESGLGRAIALNNFKDPTTYQHVYDKEVKFYKDINDRPAILGTNSMYDVWKAEAPIKLEVLDNTTANISVQGISGGVNSNASDFSERTTKTPRTRVINSLTRTQADRYGFTKNYKYYDASGVLQSKLKNNPHHGVDHTSEISILEADGMRYVYGLPAYNLTQEDASFSVEKNTTGLSIPNPTTATPAAPGYFQANSEWSKHPEYLNKTTLPAYAHSWMLTSVVSADYVDVTGNGLSEDDLGYWVDFKYQKTTDAYHWRAPYEDAMYMPGTAQDFDDKGSYSKGTKELFYLKEVRTKTHVAIYETEARNDALGASTNHNGGKPASISATDKMQKLKSIKLYTIDAYNQSNPEPLKTVHFEYMAEADALCKNVPNHAVAGGGKLTLKKVYFTYGKSSKGSLSPYEFKYANNNPNYSLKNHDCWGNYQNNNLNNYPYQEFPYTNQTPTTGDSYQAPWHLTAIELPTGGTLNIEYEQDDYAYVEAEKAMQLYDIAFTGKGGDFANLTTGNFSQRGTSVAAAHSSGLRNREHHNATGDPINTDFEYRIYFPLKTAIPDATNPDATIFYKGNTSDNGIAAWFKQHYIGNTKDLYFKAAVNLMDDVAAGISSQRNDERVDFVGGYAKLRTQTPLSHYGVDKSPNAPAGKYDIGYITVEPVEINVFAAGKDKIHPIRDAAFQHLRFARSELVHGSQRPEDVLDLFNVIPDVLNTLMGYKYAFKTENFAPEIFLDGFSQIRLLVPDGKKIGGGVRVKKMTISDNWQDMTGSSYENSAYGQVYDYTIEEAGKTISSGVAYEPFAGKEQNPLVTPVRYEHSNPMQNDNNLFLENPILMRHYPGASVGYRKVTVKSLSSVDEESKESRVPYTEYEFYTPKEFPIDVRKTEPDKSGANYDIIPIPGIYVGFKRSEAMSQGYSIIFNDMAGKMKSVQQKTYPDAIDNYEGEVISSQKYEYYTKNSARGILENEVDVFTADGVYQKAKLGIDYDIQVEMNEQSQSSDNFAIDLNLIGGILPYCIPIPSVTTGGFSTTSSSLKTAVVLKLISKSGILKSTTVTNQNSTITTENLVFDKMTGEPLLTRTKNEFNDDIYAYNQKAYWKYDGMAEAFKNTGAVLKGPYAYNTTTNGTGVYTINNVGSLSAFPLVEGDEVYIEYEENSVPLGIQATVFSIAGNGMNKEVGFAQQSGAVLDVNQIDKITIIRSGRRNLLGTSAGAIAAMDLNYQPNAVIEDTHNLTIDGTSKILNASVMTYRDYWPTDKSCESIDYCSQSICIPFEQKEGNIDASTFITKMTAGDIVIELDDELLTADDITVVGNCVSATRVVGICTGTTDPDFTVEYELNGVTTTVPHKVVQGTRCGSINTGEFTIPCAPGQNDNARLNGTQVIKVDGQVWGTDINHAKANTNCIYGHGRWNLVVPDGTNGGSHVVTDFNCMSSVHVSKVESKYTSNGSTLHPWNPINTILGQSRPLLDRLDLVTGLGTGEWQQTAGHARAYVPIGVARDMKAYDNLWLRSYDNNNIPASICYPSYLPAPKNPEMKYEFDYDPAYFHGFIVRGLSQGVHDISYETSTGDVINTFPNQNIQSPPIPIVEAQVELPANTNVIIRVRDRTGAVVNTQSLQVPPPFNTGVEIVISRIPVGTSQLDVSYDHDGSSASAQISRTFLLNCDAEDTQSSVLLCANGNTTSNTTLPFDFYQKGAKGRWRPWASYTYVSDRNYGTAAAPTPSIREKGVFEDFTPFSWVNTNSDKWQWASRSNKYTAQGYEVESVDALGNYSAALYDYNENLATVVAKNARYYEIMFDGFENYPKACKSHAHLTDGQEVVNTQSHTGEYSYRVAGNSVTAFDAITLNGINEEACAQKLQDLDPVKYSKQDILDFLQEGKETPSMKIPKIMRTATTTSALEHVESLPKECGCLGKFAPETGKKYHLSAWVKRDLAAHDVVTYQDVYLAVEFKDASGVFISGATILLPKGSMIEKWQRISGDFDVPATAVKMFVSVHNTSTGSDAAIFLDDLRMMPFESSMATYVYDKTTLRNTATLDDNNFATFYIYDEESKLIKTKKETPEGIKTINEGRQHVRGPL
ncbi:MAG: hypothetical protein ACRBFS_17450 [Aureispira sp.]